MAREVSFTVSLVSVLSCCCCRGVVMLPASTLVCLALLVKLFTALLNVVLTAFLMSVVIEDDPCGLEELHREMCRER